MLVVFGGWGLIPATLISSASVAAPSAALVPMVVGLLMQGSNLGQVVGPVAVGGVIDRFGWPSAAGIVVIAALCAAICAAALRRSFPHT
ncbi:hypothetical protein ACFQFQ_21385 [Sulfitobacter porphyrae]|uniref:Major facilitator superfamily (MFS) profile domain-containing protein n=1 Tax=Sulfitobacter porphyrae TaxID=1246864 RepID=A0ABW2B733_9RHOB